MRSLGDSSHESERKRDVKANEKIIEASRSDKLNSQGKILF